MNGAAALVSVVTVAACLVLALRSARAQQMRFGRAAAMTAAWIAIIAGLAYVLHRFGA
jgi:hypothetical protein